MVAEECYRAGASRVQMEWSCQPMTKLAYRHQSLKNLSTVPAWQEEKLKLMAEECPCRIHIASEDPDGLKGINMEKMQKAQMATYPIIRPYREAIECKHQWTIAAVPSAAWAKKVFPEMKKSQAIEALWDAILKAVRVSDDPDNDPIIEWARHNENFKKRCNWLNEKKFDYLTYKSANGTDFRVDLIPQGQWCGGGEYTKQGNYFNPNMPTEEIFTSPMKGKAEGIVYSSKPLAYNGNLIENFYMKFEGGKIVEVGAERGEETLKELIAMDEGAAYLGEVALVPYSSPIQKSGVLFYNTLFDENAACHLAFGRGFTNLYRDYENYTEEELHAKGINDSIVHEDFMIGTADMSIVGITESGERVQIFENGEWAF
jgi:aminopeptidase